MDTHISICELGGANSCIVDKVCDSFYVKKYHIIDNNEYGLNLLKGKNIRTSLSWDNTNILKEDSFEEKFDLVISIGLIEHFSETDTAKVIKYHFDRCKKGGIVLIIFPTPSISYKFIRKISEFFHMWIFLDERPLKYEEVNSECSKYGILKHKSINHLIGLSQMYLAYETST